MSGWGVKPVIGPQVPMSYLYTPKIKAGGAVVYFIYVRTVWNTHTILVRTRRFNILKSLYKPQLVFKEP